MSVKNERDKFPLTNTEILTVDSDKSFIKTFKVNVIEKDER